MATASYRRFIWTLRSIGIAFLLFLAYGVFTLHQAGIFSTSSIGEMVENYKKYGERIRELKVFFNHIVPEGYSVYIECQPGSTIDLWVYESVARDSIPESILFQQWDINPYRYGDGPPPDTSDYASKTNSLNLVKRKLRWTDETFEKIEDMLDRAECISIFSGEPSEIGFRRSGFGKYSYLVFDRPIPKDKRAEYTDSCTKLFYSDSLVLEWGGGGVGLQCFPEFHKH